MFGVGDVFSLVAVETTNESGNAVGTRMREGPPLGSYHHH